MYLFFLPRDRTISFFKHGSLFCWCSNIADTLILVSSKVLQVNKAHVLDYTGYLERERPFKTTTSIHIMQEIQILNSPLIQSTTCFGVHLVTGSIALNFGSSRQSPSQELEINNKVREAPVCDRHCEMRSFFQSVLKKYSSKHGSQDISI